MRILRSVGDDFREARVAAGLSQQSVADAAQLSRAHYSRIERGQIAKLSLLEAARIANVLGLDLSVRLYPGAEPVRDGAQVGHLAMLLREVGPPLRYRTEVPLPNVAGRFEQRAWDAVIFGGGGRTAVEVEMRVRDAQALERRLSLKRRDDPTEGFLLVLANSAATRFVLADNPELFPELPRLRRATVLAAVRLGHHPPTGLVRL
ncbi:MAG TPA: helix-turn-helix transcriptional regulator [Candidatus Limnocylindrales bacterium]|nr:helix-turn-helix transcriptional regulator [Candidatus Limnocylindrales bacterium]